MKKWMETISPFAILIGCIVDIAGSFLFSIIFRYLATAKAASRGIDPEHTQILLEQWIVSRPGMGFMLFLGLGFTALGGYVATRISKTKNLVNATFVGSVSILLGLFFISSTPKLAMFVSLILSIPAAMLGGYCRLRKWDLF
jgi:hypothetical protein